jgi:glycosyltransferase involved in cell wall biosynthesis
MTKRKILLVDLNMFYGGGQVYLESLVSLLQDKATFYSFCINPRVAEGLRKLGVTSYCYESIVNRGKPLHVLAALWIMLKLKFSAPVEILWVNGIPDIALLPFGRLLGWRTIATRHLTLEIEAQDWYRGAKRRMAELFYRIFAFTANKIVCVSRPVAEDLSQYVPPKRLTVISNWQPVLPEPVEIRPVESGPLRLLYIGRLQQYKGAYLILDAMRIMKSQGTVGRQLSLTIVGEGRYREELERQAEGLDVTFAGFQSEPWRYYRSTDIFINPTIGPEGMPLVSLEAMSYGLPCIFSDLPVHKDVSDNGKAAMLFKSGDASDLLVKLQAFLASQALVEQYAKNAREQIVNRHSAPVARARYIEEVPL